MIFAVVVFASILVFYTPILEGYELPKLLYLGGVVCGGLLWVVCKEKRIVLPLGVPIGLYLLASGISAVNAVNYYELYLQVSMDLLGISIFWITVNLVSRDNLPAVLYGVVGIGTTAALLFALLPGDQGTIGNSALAGIALAPLVPIALSLGYPGYALAGLIGVGLYLANSHAAYVALLIMTGVVIWNRAPYFRKTLAIASALILTVFMLTGATAANLSVLYRLDWWRNSGHMIVDNPVFGVGRANFQFIYPAYAIFGDRVMGEQEKMNFAGQLVKVAVRSPHNDYLQLLAEGGPLILVAFLWIVVILLRGVGARDGPTSVLALSLIGFLATAFVHFPLHTVVGSMMFWLLSGLLWVSKNEKITDHEPGGIPSRLLSGECY